MMPVVPPIPARVIAERRVAQHFQHAGAVSADAAVAYEPSRFARKRAFARLQDHGVVKPAAGGWYLDEEAWNARRGERHKRAAIIVAGAAVIGAILGSL